MPTSDGVELRIRHSHQDLANIVGSTRETVTAVLGRLQLERLVGVKRRKITLLDAERLARTVDRSVLRIILVAPASPNRQPRLAAIMMA